MGQRTGAGRGRPASGATRRLFDRRSTRTPVRKAALLLLGVIDISPSYASFTGRQYFSLLAMLSVFALAFFFILAHREYGRRR